MYLLPGCGGERSIRAGRRMDRKAKPLSKGGAFSFVIECELAEATGFEPAVSALTGLHVRPLHHASSSAQDTKADDGVSTRERSIVVAARLTSRHSPRQGFPLQAQSVRAVTSMTTLPIVP